MCGTYKLGHSKLIHCFPFPARILFCYRMNLFIMRSRDSIISLLKTRAACRTRTMVLVNTCVVSLLPRKLCMSGIYKKLSILIFFTGKATSPSSSTAWPRTQPEFFLFLMLGQNTQRSIGEKTAWERGYCLSQRKQTLISVVLGNE